MTTHPDVLEQPERLRGAFWGSVAFHVSITAVMAGYAWIGPSAKQIWGDPKGGGPGAVLVNPVASIPLPGSNAAKNPVANETPSEMVAPAPQPKAQPKAKAIEPDAIPIQSRNAKKRTERAWAAPPDKWSEKHPPSPNQVTSPTGQKLSSPLFGQQAGGGGVNLGTNTVFGTQFGEYATRMRDQIARNWKTAELDSRILTAPPVTVAFTIRRDGNLQGTVRISETSGNRAVDFSAQRAVLDAAPFPPLPAGFSGSEATVELKFQLRR